MGVLSFVSLALFAMGSATLQVNYSKPWATKESVKSFFRGKNWVVLVAGSSGWKNYRHQADLCHAYQIVRENGIPEENIITMMVDDIAYNERNPTPGKIINQPDGEDVYNGVVIDYRGADVNSTNFLKIITGDKKGMESVGTGKVIEGGPRDLVFINFVDHGTTGALSFPNDLLFADQLNDALKTMYASASYKMVLIYIEACKAGSMFDGILRDNTGVLAITASGPRENSVGCYCSSQSGPYHTCLGDLFSVTWMENWDDIALETSTKNKKIFIEFEKTRTDVTESNVMMYGDFKTGYEKLSSFIGYNNHSDHPPVKPRKTKTNEPKITMSSRHVAESDLVQQLADHKSDSKTHNLQMDSRLNTELRLIIDTTLQNIYLEITKARPEIASKVGDYYEPKNLGLSLDMFPCYRSILNKITDNCFSLTQNPYVLDRLTIFANLCVVDKQIHNTIGSLISATCSRVRKLHLMNVY